MPRLQLDDARCNGQSLLSRSRGRSGRDRVKKTIVDLRPWQTAQALAPLAVTAEEKEFARNAQRLADHEVDQAFASALRQAMLQAKNIKLNGEALALSQKVTQLQQLIKQDQAQVRHHFCAIEVLFESCKSGSHR